MCACVTVVCVCVRAGMHVELQNSMLVTGYYASEIMTDYRETESKNTEEKLYKKSVRTTRLRKRWKSCDLMCLIFSAVVLDTEMRLGGKSGSVVVLLVQ